MDTLSLSQQSPRLSESDDSEVNLTAVAHSSTDAPLKTLPSVKLADVPEALQKACARAGWAELMPVQQHSLPYLFEGRDLMVQSHTGSGKTGTYLLPMLQRLDPALKAVQALALVPTRELAVQVEQEAKRLFAGTGLSVTAVYGGVGYERQNAALKSGVSMVVGTPGRILDHLLRRSLRLDALKAIVFDEADRMLSIGFYPDMKEIQRYLPNKPRQATLFSATYPPHVLRLAGEFLHEPELLSLSSSQVHVADVRHTYCECKSMDKDRVLLRLLEVENPASAIIFCNTKSNVHYLTAVLQGFGFSADELSADLSQQKREAVLNKLRKGHIRLLVATDVAARGIDVPDLSHVFLYEPPDDRESYIHRAGRTGRAGAAGVVISLVDIMQKMELVRIARFYSIALERILPPTEEDATKALGQRAQALLEARYRQLGSIERERLARLEPLARELAADPEQYGLLAMILDETYQQCARPETRGAGGTALQQVNSGIKIRSGQPESAKKKTQKTQKPQSKQTNDMSRPARTRKPRPTHAVGALPDDLSELIEGDVPDNIGTHRNSAPPKNRRRKPSAKKAPL